MGTEKSYNYCLDFIKGFVCIFVVWAHCEFPGRLGIAIQAVIRFSVPFFFMVSGYFCYKPLSENVQLSRLKKKICHLLKITIVASLFYLIFQLIQQCIWHDIDFSISMSKIINLFVFNCPLIVAGQYWFLLSLIYAYLLYALFEKLGWRKFAYIFSAIMFVVYIVLAQGLHLYGVKVPNMYYRNFLVEAFPFFMFGHWINEHKDRLKISNRTLYLIFGISTLLCFVERYIMGRDFGVNIVTFPQIFALFLYAINNPNRHKGVMQEIGKRFSLYVYVIHPFVWHIFERVYDGVGISTNILALYAMPILVVVATFIVSYFVEQINNKWFVPRTV